MYPAHRNEKTIALGAVGTATAWHMAKLAVRNTLEDRVRGRRERVVDLPSELIRRGAVAEDADRERGARREKREGDDDLDAQAHDTRTV